MVRKGRGRLKPDEGTAAGVLNALQFDDEKNAAQESQPDDPKQAIADTAQLERDFGTLAENKRSMAECDAEDEKINRAARRLGSSADKESLAGLKFRAERNDKKRSAAENRIKLLNKRELGAEGVRRVRVDVFEYMGGTRRLRLGGEL